MTSLNTSYKIDKIVFDEFALKLFLEEFPNAIEDENALKKQISSLSDSLVKFDVEYEEEYADEMSEYIRDAVGVNVSSFIDSILKFIFPKAYDYLSDHIQYYFYDKISDYVSKNAIKI